MAVGFLFLFGGSFLMADQAPFFAEISRDCLRHVGEGSSRQGAAFRLAKHATDTRDRTREGESHTGEFLEWTQSSA